MQSSKPGQSTAYVHFCTVIVFVWSRNGSNKTKAFVKGLLAPKMKIVGGATYWKKSDLLSVNQLAASVKILEAWKSLNINNYPIILEPNIKCSSNGDRQVRPSTSRLWNQDARTNAARESFSRNTAKIWNAAPMT